MTIRLKNRILFPAAVCMAAVSFMACTSDKTPEGIGDDRVEIRLAAAADVPGTRAGGEGEAAVNLVAYNGENSSLEYFGPTAITSVNPLTTSASDLTLSSTRYYPLGANEINLFAFTGSINANKEMQLTGGNDEDKNDFILSNYGKRRLEDLSIVDTPEGEGTPGSSTEPATLLQFRHVMTQLTVRVEVDRSQSNWVDPEPETVEFEIEDLLRLGTYPITATTPDPQNGPVTTANYMPMSGKQKVELGVNYLIPSGMDLIGKTFSSLVIDEYEATDDDLKEFVITGDDPQMPLYPGYAYVLTLKIQKLRVVGVVLEQVDWKLVSKNGQNPTYDPNILNLDITGGYSNMNDDQITKVVLHTTDKKQYVGKAGDNLNQLEFVTLPADGLVDSVDLFTPKGLLLSMPVDATQYASQTLSFALDDVGMLLADPNNPVNSATNPYIVSTLVQFLNVEKNLGGYYRQVNDLEFAEIDVTGVSSLFSGFGKFTGVYDGNSHWLGNMDVKCQAIFAENEGTLLNMRLYYGNMDVSGYTYAGSLCGVNRGLIYGCINEVSLFGATNTVGGICGLNEAGGRIIACVNTGDIWAGTTLGGICGENQNTDAGTFLASLSIGHVYPGGTSGSIIGRSVNAASTAVIETCFWLDGTVETASGQNEAYVGSGTVGINDSAGLDADKMRNGIDEGEDPVTDRILYKLNTALTADTEYNPDLRYYLDYKLTGITWPMPYNVNNIP